MDLAFWLRVFHGFWQAKSSFVGSILGFSQFLQLPQQPQYLKLASKVSIVI
jgi:hypothetical protein